jgi:allophanate hydrolase
VTVGGKAHESWRTLQIEAGQTLRLGWAKSGLRAYLAFEGGLKAERFADSASVVVRVGLPGSLGQPVATGQTLQWYPGSAGASSESKGLVPVRYRLPPGPSLTVEFVPAYEWLEFSEADANMFVSTDWTVTPLSDRVACRLEGPPILSGPKVLDSVPLVDGTIQVLADGTPLVFMRDRPTIGGYAKLGAVLPAHLDRLAQARPGTVVRFVVGNATAARAEAARTDAFFGVRT